MHITGNIFEDMWYSSFWYGFMQGEVVIYTWYAINRHEIYCTKVCWMRIEDRVWVCFKFYATNKKILNLKTLEYWKLTE